MASEMQQYRERVESKLLSLLSSRENIATHLNEAMQYSLLNGGKRLRPILVYQACRLLGGSLEQADNAACAIEAIHSYSLVHDDLPAMDDDDLRRGKPTCHIKFDEATAILAGDALLTLAFELLSDDDSLQAPDIKLKMVQTLAKASGDLGMVDGQAFDLGSVGKALTLEQLQAMHGAKTGALIRAALRLGALASNNATPENLTALDQYGIAIGLAFQIQDDILDIEGSTEQLGKPQGSDLERDKPTYPALMGLEASKAWLEELVEQANEALASFGEQATPLREIAQFIISRSN
jgi:geranylgeranyl diphosphate synthase type II